MEWANKEVDRLEAIISAPQKMMNELATVIPAPTPRELTELISETEKVLQEDNRRPLANRDKTFPTLVDYLSKEHGPWRRYLVRSFPEKFAHANSAHSSLKAIADHIYKAIPDDLPMDDVGRKRYDKQWINHRQALDAFASASQSPTRVYAELTREFISVRKIMLDYAKTRNIKVKTLKWEPLGMSGRPSETKYQFIGSHRGMSCLKIDSGGAPTFIAIETKKLCQALGIPSEQAIKDKFTLPIKDGKLLNTTQQMNRLKRKAQDSKSDMRPRKR